MTETVRVVVIMAGGSGERFWPLSRANRPKQLLHLASPDQSLLQESVSRVLPLLPPDRIFIATGLELRDAVCAGETRLEKKNVLAEPCRRNTAGCLIWAAANLMARYGDHTEVAMGVLTADHQIGGHERFRQMIDAALETAANNKAIVTIGMQPERPDTGYGYIELERMGEPVMTSGGIPALPVHRFREKPNRETAEEFVAGGRHLWNSGMFFWRVSVFLEELTNARPEMAMLTRRMAGALRAEMHEEAANLFSQLESISIDYALMEDARRVLVIKGDFPWEDVGSWDSLERTREAGDQGNVIIGDPVLIDCENCIVYNEPGAAKMAVGVIGIEDVVIVTSGDSVLVVAKDRVQDVKKVVAELKSRGASQT